MGVLGRHRSAAVVFFIAAAALTASPTKAVAEPSDLDASFGSGGIVVTPPPGGTACTEADPFSCFSLQAFAVLDPPEGITVVGIQSRMEPPLPGEDPLVIAYGINDITVARYEDDGDLDGCFHDGDPTGCEDKDGGIVVTSLGQYTSISSNRNDVVARIDNDGKLLVVAAYFVQTTGAPSDRGFALFRFDTDGDLDSTFGALGISKVSTGADLWSVGGVAVEADGDIRVVAHKDGVGLAMVGFTPTGQLQSAFATGGFAQTTFDKLAWSLDLDSSGRFLAGVEVFDDGAGRPGFGAARFTSNGLLDPTYGGDGIAEQATSLDAETADGTLQNGTGLAVVVGEVEVDPDACDGEGAHDFGITRFTGNGDVDAFFGDGGTRTLDAGGCDDAAYAVATQTNGKLVLAGRFRASDGTDDDDFAVGRVTPSGDADPTFGTGGVKVTSRNGSETAYAVMVQAGSGKIVAAGTAHGGTGCTTSCFMLIRYAGGEGPPAAAGKPDAWIGSPGGPFAGNNVYNATGRSQKALSKILAGQVVRYEMVLQNDGIAPDSYAIKGSTARRFGVRYYDGATEITGAVQAGTHVVGPLAPGASKTLTVKIKARSTAIDPARILTTATSVTDAQIDAVLAVVRILPSP